MKKTIALVPRLDSTAAESLAHELRAAMDNDIHIDGSKVKFCGVLALQVMIAARRHSKKSELNFQIESTSEELLESCRLSGISCEEIGLTAEASLS